MSMVTESEKKRLQSLKEKKQAFKVKGQFIQQALRNLVSRSSIHCNSLLCHFKNSDMFYS